jgi:hypothetical protein
MARIARCAPERDLAREERGGLGDVVRRDGDAVVAARPDGRVDQDGAVGDDDVEAEPCGLALVGFEIEDRLGERAGADGRGFVDRDGRDTDRGVLRAGVVLFGRDTVDFGFELVELGDRALRDLGDVADQARRELETQVLGECGRVDFGLRFVAAAERSAG